MWQSPAACRPGLDIWTIAEPVVGDWIGREAGPLGRIEDLRDGLSIAGEMFSRLPAIVARAETLLADFEKQRRLPVRRGVPAWLIISALSIGIATCAVIIAVLLH